jgi:hypothetical protein
LRNTQEDEKTMRFFFYYAKCQVSAFGMDLAVMAASEVLEVMGGAGRGLIFWSVCYPLLEVRDGLRTSHRTDLTNDVGRGQDGVFSRV